MGREDKEQFEKQLKEKIDEQGGSIEINESVSKKFETRCIDAVNIYANKVHDWREKSLQSTSFIG